jgi:hypothetical protein
MKGIKLAKNKTWLIGWGASSANGEVLTDGMGCSSLKV